MNPHNIKKSLLLLGLSALFFMIAFFADYGFIFSPGAGKMISRFTNAIHQKENLLEDALDEIIRHGEKNMDEIYKKDNSFFNPFSAEGIVLLIYKNDTLQFWSDNSVPVARTFSSSSLNQEAAYLKNAWYLIQNKKTGNYRIVALAVIKTEYSYENKFLKNEFSRGLLLPKEYKISLKESGHSYRISNRNGHLLFHVNSSQKMNKQPLQRNISGLFYLLCFLVLTFFIYASYTIIIEEYHSNLWLIALLGDLLLLRFLMIHFHFPHSLYELELFQPEYYSGSFWFRSLGDFLLNAIFLCFFSYIIYKKFRQPERFFSVSEIRMEIFVCLSSALLLLYFFFIRSLFSSLIFHSSILFEIYKVSDLTIFSLIGFFIIALLFASFFLLTDKIIHICAQSFPLKQWVIFHFAVFILLLLTLNLTGIRADIYSVIFYAIIILTVTFIRFIRKKYPYSLIILILFFISAYSVYFITRTSHQKEIEIRRFLAEDLAAERDYIAEMLLEDMYQKISSDQTLIHNLKGDTIIRNNIYDYLEKNYFYGFFSKYEPDISVCGNTEYFEPENQLSFCKSYFNHIIRAYGFRLQTGKEFYYLDDSNGKITYLLAFEFSFPEKTSQVTLYIELNSRLVTEELGYPELLLDNRFIKKPMLSGYSYANYHKGQLITQSGDFRYSMGSETFSVSDKEYIFLSFDHYSHLVYQINRNNLIVLSKPEMSGLDILISFSYLFVFFFLLLSLSMVISKMPFKKGTLRLTLKDKINAVMITVLLVTMLLVGGGTVYYILKKYQIKNNESISEKMQSVLIEMEHKLIQEKAITPEQQAYLSSLLYKFSQVFYSDINLYDPNGFLFASSRNEIFEKGLISRMMNPVALYEMKYRRNAEFIHKEKIGSLNYMSAYVPLRNRENKLLAYLNLPYFTKQKLMQKEISDFIVAVINIYVLLILLTILLAVFLSNRITQPLRMVQEKFREIQLGQKYETILYKGEDEIGSLIREYNKKVAELAKSAELLAKSERESAWREMAKQIAHEIKNPLTPMRLNVQLLERLWNNKDPHFEEKLKNIVQTLIDQIDNLSSIASGFSDFARLPAKKREPVDIIERINNCVTLYKNTENIQFQMDFHSLPHAYTYADKEQMLSVFNNLIQNAIQSIPENRQGLIAIDVVTKDKTILINVSDNGAGIPDELKKKMFEPNFTTKTSGMGLGLSITRNIVEDAEGKIRFETESGKGTTLFIKLPLYNKYKE